MVIQQVILLVINIVGGIAVIGSYVLGLVTHQGSGNALWGGMPEAIRPVYGVSMILAAIGYFAFVYYIILRLVPADVQIAGRFGFGLFYVVFLGILVPSALWMPFTYAYIGSPSIGMWVAIRVVLVLVGLSSAALVWVLLSLQTKEPVMPYWFAVGGSAYFAFHTAVLDMILWPMLFKV